MKRNIIAATTLTMMLCGCGELKYTSNYQSLGTITTQGQQQAQADATDAAPAAAETPAAAEAPAAEAPAETAAANTEAAETPTVPAVTYSAPAAANNEPATDAVFNNVFAGNYYDANSGASLSVDCINDVLYSVHISLKKSDKETTEWNFTGEFNGRQVLNYDSCVKSIRTVGDDGSVSSEQQYTNGTGYIQISEEGSKTGFVWSDSMENAGANAFFVKQ